MKRHYNPGVLASVWRAHHQRMLGDDHYAHVVIQALVKVAWQDSLALALRVIVRAALELARSRFLNR